MNDDPVGLKHTKLASVPVFGMLLGGRWTYGPGGPSPEDSRIAGSQDRGPPVSYLSDGLDVAMASEAAL